MLSKVTCWENYTSPHLHSWSFQFITFWCIIWAVSALTVEWGKYMTVESKAM